jgi:hypothetical protein
MLTRTCHRVLIATIRNQGLCPCPRCLVPQSKLDQMGSNIDMKNRTEKARKYLPDNVRNARRAIYELGRPIGGAAVDRSLKATSSVPTSVSSPFSTMRQYNNILRLTWHILECFCRAPWSQLQSITDACRRFHARV